MLAWVRECVSGAVAFTPPPERTCSVCRQSLRPFLFASGRLGPQYIWIHTDGSILDEHHRPFPIWTLLGGDGGA